MERFDMEELYAKAGGIFRLTVLVQKRLKQLNKRTKPLVNIDSKNPRDFVYQEILEGKIRLVAGEDEVEEIRQEEKVTESVKDMFRKTKSDFKLPSLKQ